MLKVESLFQIKTSGGKYNKWSNPSIGKNFNKSNISLNIKFQRIIHININTKTIDKDRPTNLSMLNNKGRSYKDKIKSKNNKKKYYANHFIYELERSDRINK